MYLLKNKNILTPNHLKKDSNIKNRKKEEVVFLDIWLTIIIYMTVTQKRGFPLFDYFADNAAGILALAGLLTGVWFFDWIIRRPEAEEERPAHLIVFDILGFIVGVIALGAGVTLLLNGQQPFIEVFGGLIGGKYDLFTKILIVVVGLCLFLKPLKDLPLASLVALIVGAVAVFLTITYLQTMFTWLAQLLNIDIRIFYGVIFVAVYAIIFSLFKFAEYVLHALATILGSKIGSFVIMVFCLLQALLLIIPPPVTHSLGHLFGLT